MPGPISTNWGPGSVNTNWEPGSVNTDCRPGPGAKQRVGGREIQILDFYNLLQYTFFISTNNFSHYATETIELMTREAVSLEKLFH